MNQPHNMVDPDGLDGVFGADGSQDQTTKDFSSPEKSPGHQETVQIWKGKKFVAFIGLLLVLFLGLYILPSMQIGNEESSKGEETPDRVLQQHTPEPNPDTKKFTSIDTELGDTSRNKKFSGDTKTQVARDNLEASAKDLEAIAGSTDSLPLKKGETRVTSPAKELRDDVPEVISQTPKSDVVPKPARQSAPMGGKPAQPLDAGGFTLYFPFNSTKILGFTGKRHEDLLALISACEGPIEIVGHTCNIGHGDINLAIGLGRAVEVKNLLIEAGTDAGRFTVRSAGEKSPVASNQTRTGRSKNRRVEFFCSKRDKR